MSTHTKRFAGFLQEGETIEWVSKAEPFVLLDQTNKQSLMIRWLISAVIAVLLVAGYLAMVGQNDVSASWVVIAVLLGGPIFAAVRPLTDARALKKNVVFAITDRRAITSKGGSDFFAINLDEVTAIRFVEKAGGVGDVLFGDATKMKDRKLRLLSLVPQVFKEENNPLTGLVFYNVGEIHKVKKYLEERIGTQI